MMFRTVALYTIFFFTLFSGYSQTQISGIIKSTSNLPLVGVNVYVLNTYDGTATNQEGLFSFTTETSGKQILVASAIGLQEFAQEINIDGNVDGIEIILSEEVKKLDDLVISAGVFEVSDEKKAVILKPLDIVTTAGATADIPGALNTLPGTQIVGETGKLFVRGGSGEETKTFIDGILVDEPYSLSPNNIPSRMRFSPFLFSGTAFSTGGYSAEYGQALSGTLVLSTDSEPLETQTDLSLMTVGVGIAHTQKWEKNSIFFETNYTDLTPYFLLVPQKTKWNNAPSSWQNTFMFRQKTGEYGNLRIFYNNDFSRMSINQLEPVNLSENVRVDLNNQYHYLNINYESPLNKYWYLKTGISKTFSNEQANLEQLSSSTTLNSGHVKVVLSYDKGVNVGLKIGAEIYQNHFIDKKQSSYENGSIQNEFEDWIPSLFLESNIYISQKFVALVGGRFEYSNLSDKATVMPRISMAYRTGEFSQISIASGIYRQRPQAQFISQNHKLDDEGSAHFILNYQISKDQKTFRAEIYRKNYERLIRYSWNTNGIYGNINNDGTGYAQGFDLFWRDGNTIKGVDYWISYSYLDTERNYKNFPSASIPSFSSRHNLSVVVKYFVENINTQFGISYAYASPRPYNNPNSDKFNAGRTPSYHDLSMNLSYLVKTNFIIHLSVTNILGRDNIFGYQYSLSPDNAGNYNRIPIEQGAKRFLFLGAFFTLSKDKSRNQLRNL